VSTTVLMLDRETLSMLKKALCGKQVRNNARSVGAWLCVRCIKVVDVVVTGDRCQVGSDQCVVFMLLVVGKDC
jgi:hypothetical protein